MIKVRRKADREHAYVYRFMFECLGNSIDVGISYRELFRVRDGWKKVVAFSRLRKKTLKRKSARQADVDTQAA